MFIIILQLRTFKCSLSNHRKTVYRSANDIFRKIDLGLILSESKALGGSFKLVTPAPKTVREMTQLPRETQKDGETQTN